MIARVVVLGTGTGVGKTWSTAAIARAATPGACLALKPIETGCAPGSVPADAAILQDATGAGPEVPLYMFVDPVTPMLAAERAGIVIELEAVNAWVKNQERHYIASHYAASGLALSFVESAGGVFSPLSPTATNLEMTQVLNPDLVVLVAPNRLGVLHDVGSTLRAMQHHGQPPDLVVLNNTMPLDASSDSNASLLRRLYPRQVFAELGHSDPESAATLLQRIRESVAARKSSS